jgi:hypothetical protein
MPVTHEPWLVALSPIIAIQGAYVAGHRAHLPVERDGAPISSSWTIWSPSMPMRITEEFRDPAFLRLSSSHIRQ